MNDSRERLARLETQVERLQEDMSKTEETHNTVIKLEQETTWIRTNVETNGVTLGRIEESIRNHIENPLPANRRVVNGKFIGSVIGSSIIVIAAVIWGIFQVI